MVSIIIPSLNRPLQLQRCIHRLIETSQSHLIEIICVLDTGDDDSAHAVSQLAVEVLAVTAGASPVEKWNAGASIAKGGHLVFAADDLYWGMGWLAKAVQALSVLGGSGMVGFNDLAQDGNALATHFLVTRDYAVGSWGGVLAVPHYRSYFCDVEATERAIRDNRYIFAEDAIVEHRHYLWGKAAVDSTYRLSERNIVSDKAIYHRRRERGFPNDYDLVFGALPLPYRARYLARPRGQRRTIWMK